MILFEIVRFFISKLQREQMLEAQEMFRTANKVTRPEKALILGFMAGSRGMSIFFYKDFIYFYTNCVNNIDFVCR